MSRSRLTRRIKICSITIAAITCIAVPTAFAAKISIGNRPVNDISVGNIAINKAYIGDQLVWTRPAPTITSFSPSYGINNGIKPTYGVAGSTVAIIGNFLRTATAVKIGNTNCASFTKISDKQVNCILPAGLISGNTYDISVTTPGGTATISNILTYDPLMSIYQREMVAIENIIQDIIDSGNPSARIGTALTDTTAVTILGINYGANWYKVTSSELLAVNPNLDVSHADYIVKYETSTAGAVQSIPGELVDNSRIHTFNYTGDGFVIEDILTGVDSNSTKTNTSWGEFNLVDASPTGITYDQDGGLQLGTDYATLSIDQTKPIGERYTIGFTIKGPIPQLKTGGFAQTLVAISPMSASYLSWIGIYGKYLHVYSYYSGSALTIDTDTLNQPRDGFTSIDLTTIGDFNNQYLNIYVSAERKTSSTITYTNIYINGALVRTIRSGSPVLGYATLTLGDLRAGRGLKYSGSVYDFTLYSEALDAETIAKNYAYSISNLLDN